MTAGVVTARVVTTRVMTARVMTARVIAVDLHPAIAANPYLAFWLRADGPGTLSFEWWGDWGFHHRETRAVQPT